MLIKNKIQHLITNHAGLLVVIYAVVIRFIFVISMLLQPYGRLVIKVHIMFIIFIIILYR